MDESKTNDRPKSEPRPPDYNAWAITTIQGGTHSGRVGAAWTNEDGSIHVVLNPFVTLSAASGLTLKLFPVEPKKPKEDSIPF